MYTAEARVRPTGKASACVFFFFFFFFFFIEEKNEEMLEAERAWEVSQSSLDFCVRVRETREGNFELRRFRWDERSVRRVTEIPATGIS